MIRIIERIVSFFRRKKSPREAVLTEMNPFYSGRVYMTERAHFINGLDASRVMIGERESDDKRIEINPAEIVALFEQPVEVNVADIEDKLKILYERAAVYKETLKTQVPRDLQHAIRVLEARKNYPKMAKQIPWKTTTKEKIDDLCKKYKLSHRETEQFIPELPQRAIDEIQAFKRMNDLAFAHEPRAIASVRLTIVAPTKMFRERKGDPILLADSPFGNFLYILCAWDEEVNFVKELIA